jgi:isoleucyl-tRNA synthetase
MPFGPVAPSFDLAALEQRVLERWRRDDLPARVQDLRKDGTPWIFYEGPPTANGRPGLHHVWARAFKDLFPRFQTMRGHAVPRKGGWDCHGLPVELEVEKSLGLHSKGDIEAYGIAAFNQRCRDSVQEYVNDWTSLTERAGVWIDTADAYWTLTNDYIESVWWLVRQMWDRGLLYEGHRVVPYCGRCGTALSSHEVAQGYQDVVDPSVYVRFPLTSVPAAASALEGADLLVWTTTPWTLVSNVATAVGAAITYQRVRAGTGGLPAGHDLVVAATARGRRWPEAEVVAEVQGADLVGARYERPFALLEPPTGSGDAWRVVTADFVTTDDGSGIVHMAPAFGEDDAKVGRAEGLPVLNPVTAQATFDDSVPQWAGRFVRDADEDIIAELQRAGRLVLRVPYEHSYPHCWRCGTPLIYWAKTSWFARTSDRRNDLLAQNERIGWHPAHIKHGRFGNWLENNVDWALSRDRYWGTPLPIWRCTEDHDTCVGSVAELAERAGRDLSDLDLHRPYLDEVTFPCGAEGCDATASRLAPVLDAWFDSGSMPSAQRHHPFEGAATFDQNFPADFICEAIDQTRGWFYSLLAVNTLVFGQTPYRNVVCLGLLVDADGLKMSKSRGNIVDPWTVFEHHGADALRWYFFSAGQPWAQRRVMEDAIRESARRTLLTLWNCFSFFATYADLDGWEPDFAAPPPSHQLDRWILSELDETIAVMTDALEDFDALTAADRLARLVDDLSNWYVRRNRPRFWKSADPSAHATLYRCLVAISRLLAPFCPFLADELHMVLTEPTADGPTSVHMADWPTQSGWHDPALAAEVAASRRLVALGRAARTDAAVKVRQPLRRALVLHPGVELDDGTRAEIAGELNVKVLEDVDTLSGLLTWTVTPNFRVLGPRLGPRIGEMKAALAAADGTALQRQLEADGFIEVLGERLGPDDVETRASRHESFALAEDAGWAVALDLELDDELRLEGRARELVRAVNDLRKEQGFAIADRVDVAIAGADDLIEAYGDWIAGEVLAASLRRDPATVGSTLRLGDDDAVTVGLALAR